MATATGQQNLLPDLKARIGLPTTNNQQDALLALSLSGAWRSVQNYTHRRFYSVTATYYYSVAETSYLQLDDVQTISALRTDDDNNGSYETTWSATCYNLAPYNATVDAEPFTGLEVTPNSSLTLPTGVPKGVQVVGAFGYCPSTALPEDVREAILYQAEQSYLAHSAPFGVAGGRDFSVEMDRTHLGLHPFTAKLLNYYRRRVVG